MKKLCKYLPLIIPIIVLNIISLLNLYNAKYISSLYDGFFFKQCIWFFLSYVIVIVLQKINLEKVIYYSKYLYIFSIVLLIMVLFFGSEIKGAKCWFNIFGISFQPSELVKLTLLFYGVYLINKNKYRKNKVILLLKLFIITLIPSVLVFLEPDTGAIINYLLIFIVFIFNIKLDKKFYIMFGVSFILCVICFVFSFVYFKEYLIKIFGTGIFYRVDRIINFYNGNSYQLLNALTTISVSSFWGSGLKNILLYIPEAPTDFIFSFSVESFGIFSAIIILLSYLVILLYLINKEKYVNSNYVIILKSFIVILIFHVIYNISMNLGFLPIMGIPLPFLSYGGSSTLINFIFVGIILNVLENNKTA